MNVYKVLITEKVEGPWIEEIKSRFSVKVEHELWQNPDKLKDLISDCNAIIIRNQTNLSKDIISEAKDLKIIARAGAGLNNIDVEAASESGIVVVNTPDQNSIAVAEHTIGMMLSLARKMTSANAHMQKGIWNREKFIGSELYDKTLGVVGLGRIGFLTALRAKAFGMNILAYDKFVSPDAAFVTESHAKLVELDELLENSDFVSCHIPLTSDTQHLFGYERFCQMKSTAFFLNLARGEVVDEKGLIQALKKGKILGAGLDVREKEPPESNPFSMMENIILTPHIAAFTEEAQERVASALCKDVIKVLDGKAAKNFVNFSKPKNLHVFFEEN